MNPTHLWPLVPALAVVLLHLSDFYHDLKRVVVAIVALAVCVGWAWRLSVEAKKRDADTDARDADIPREAMWRAIVDQRDEP